MGARKFGGVAVNWKKKKAGQARLIHFVQLENTFNA
jgi:hypothetical protein